MSTYLELKQQAEELMKQAEALRDAERNAVIEAVRNQIAEWQITAAELGFKNKARRKMAAKYRDPETGNEWCGRGAMPRWLASHLAVGHTKEQFLIA